MRIPNRLNLWAIVAVMAVAGCASKQPANSGSSSGGLGVLSRDDAPAEVAAVRTFYVAPNTQATMSNTFVAGASLQQSVADRIATKLTAKGLTQAPQDMADATVTFTVHTPTPPSSDVMGDDGSPTEGLAYADRLLGEANAMQSADNFLANDRVDMRVRMISNKTHQPIWRGSIAGVQAADGGDRGRFLNLMDALDSLMNQYPKVQK